jgi:hypothetical protein
MRFHLVGRIAGQLLAEEIEAATPRAAAERVEATAARHWARGPVRLLWAAPGLAIILLHDAAGGLTGHLTVDAQTSPAAPRGRMAAA